MVLATGPALARGWLALAESSLGIFLLVGLGLAAIIVGWVFSRRR